MTREQAILVIRAYVNTYLFLPKTNWSEYEFQNRSCSRWVAAEIIDRLRTDYSNGHIETIRKFIDQMDRYSELEGNPIAWFLFYLARENAKDILALVE